LLLRRALRKGLEARYLISARWETDRAGFVCRR
jgi:hypothetical protein